MRPLVLCQACRRHVKVSETSCPFCDAAVIVERQGTQRARGLPGGRAALFLAGTALAATGCADDEPDEEQHVGRRDAATQHSSKDAGRDGGMLVAQPYGIAIDPRDASIVTPPDAGPSCPQVGNLPVPVYGIGIDVPPRDLCSDAGADAGLDAGRDSGPLATPPYGISIDPNR
jgi:hypothetical protein